MELTTIQETLQQQISVELPPQTAIFNKGERLEYFYLICSGEIALIDENQEIVQIIANRGALGLVEYLTALPCRYTARTLTKVKALKVNRQAFQQLHTIMPEILPSALNQLEHIIESNTSDQVDDGLLVVIQVDRFPQDPATLCRNLGLDESARTIIWNNRSDLLNLLRLQKQFCPMQVVFVLGNLSYQDQELELLALADSILDLRSERTVVSVFHLQQHLLLQSLAHHELSLLVPFFTRHKYQAGQNIIRQGQKSSQLYLITSGSVEELILDKNNEERLTHTYQCNEAFGNLQINQQSIYPATIRAKEVTECLVLSGDAVPRLLRDNPEVIAHLNLLLSTRLSKTISVIVGAAVTEEIVVEGERVRGKRVMDWLIRYIEQYSGKSVGIQSESGGKTQFVYNLSHGQNNRVPGEQVFVVWKSGDKESKRFSIDLLRNETEIDRDIQRIVRTITRKRVGLALGSGMAAGLGHIGVLSVLQKHKIPVDLVCGTSGGALYGTMFCMGYDLSEYKARIIREARKTAFSLWDMRRPWLGLQDGGRIRSMMRRYFHKRTFDQLEIPLKVTAVDIATLDSVILENGNVADAVRASISMPLIFEPVEREGRLLADGAAVLPMPVATCRDSGMDIILAVNIINNPVLNGTPSAIDTFLRSRQASCRALVEKELKGADLVLNLDFSDIGFMEYSRAEEIINRAMEQALQMIPELRCCLYPV